MSYTVCLELMCKNAAGCTLSVLLIVGHKLYDSAVTLLS